MTEQNKEPTAAQMLFEARTSGRRKRETSTIARLLCIREEYLIALENGDYHLIPEVVYILGFARNYAIELGLDPKEIVSKIKKEMGLQENCDSVPSVEPCKDDDKTIEESVIKNRKKLGKAKKLIFEKTSKYLYKYWKWLIAGTIALIVLILGLSFVLSLGRTGENLNSEEILTAAVKEPEYKQAVREKFGAENAATARIILQASQESWVKIEDARGNTVFSRVLVPGDVYYLPNSDKNKGTFGNAGGLDVWVDGKLIQKLGALNVRKSGIVMTPEKLVGEETKESE